MIEMLLAALLVAATPVAIPQTAPGLCQEIADKASDSHAMGSAPATLILQAAGLHAEVEQAFETHMAKGGAYAQFQLSARQLERLRSWYLREVQYGNLTCTNTTAFGVRNGSFLKYAAKMENFDTIVFAVEWGLNLNTVDPSDNRTLLDYLEDERNLKPRGSDVWRKLDTHAAIVRRAGGKRRIELADEEIIWTCHPCQQR